MSISLEGYTQDTMYAREVLSVLCADQLAGRAYVNRGDKKAATYIRKELKRNGVSPLWDNYAQAFPVNVNTYQSAVTIRLGDKEMQPGIDFLIEPSSPSIKGTYPIQSFGAKEILLQDEIQEALSGYGGFVLIDTRTTQDLTPEERQQLGRVIRDLQAGLAPEISGLIELTSENLIWGISGEVSVKPFIRINAALAPDTLSNIFVDFKSKFKENYYTENIGGYIRGTSNPDSFVILSAHYDHVGMMGKETLFPGANDNASGVAMLLSIASYFNEHPPDYTVIFLFFSAEELGLIGSAYFVRFSPIDLSSVRFLINLDMVGSGSQGIKVVNGSIYQVEYNTLLEINAEKNYLPVIFPRGAACNSDHCPFDYARVPGFYIYTEGGSADYHSMLDIPERLTLNGFEGLGNLIIDFINSM